MRERWQPGGLFASFSGSRGGDCSQTGSMQYERISATTWRSFSSGRFSTSPDDRASRARHANGRAVPYWRKLLFTNCVVKEFCELRQNEVLRSLANGVL